MKTGKKTFVPSICLTFLSLILGLSCRAKKLKKQTTKKTTILAVIRSIIDFYEEVCFLGLKEKRLRIWMKLENLYIVNLALIGYFIILSKWLGLYMIDASKFVAWMMGAPILFACVILWLKWRTGWQNEYKGQLMTTGAYSQIRHPKSSLLVLTCIGLSIAFRSKPAVFLSIILLGSLIPKAKIEEGKLTKIFGQKYLDYCRKVKGRFIPGLL
ncbi:MAG: methyltransferase [Candidatus Altiarchaeota archaeon]